MTGLRVLKAYTRIFLKKCEWSKRKLHLIKLHLSPGEEPMGEQTPGKEMRHIAEIPLVIYQKGLREGWINDKKKLKQWLNNPDNRMFRTWKGRV